MQIIADILVAVFLLLSSLNDVAYSAERCNSRDKKTLLKIKESFGNPYIISSWHPDNDCCTDWNQVECDDITNRIISLTIFAGDLPGKIPPEVGDLTFLKTLVFRKLSNLTGPVQPAIAKLKHLEFLRLDHLSLTGSVPGFLSGLTSLTYLDLSFNQLSGSIPSSFSGFTDLVALHLDRNQLTGTIPDSFGTFKGTIPDLYLSHNQLSGKIPTSLGKMDFSTIDLSRNKLEGDASMLFGLNKMTYQVDISRNLFEFDLSKVVFPHNLEVLHLNHNKVYGKMAPQMTQLAMLFLNVSYNRLCGQIPQGGNLQTFDIYSYVHNQCLCGSPLDSSLCTELCIQDSDSPENFENKSSSVEGANETSSSVKTEKG